MSKRALTAKQEAFVSEYLVDQNGTQAYHRAFPRCSLRTARTEAAKLLALPRIRAEIAAARRELSKRAKVTAAKIICEIAAVAFFDPLDLFEHSPTSFRFRNFREVPYGSRQVITSFKAKRVRTRTTTAAGTTVTETVEILSVKWADKLRALDMLMRHHGLYKDLPPLEVLLAMLPKGMGDAVREQLQREVAGP
ncbi:MAG: hypothetical protein C0467_31525 [Planctomycetaceae bacterium]|nr:hypothetical protein [Planctomycetaceae bacterium]